MKLPWLELVGYLILGAIPIFSPISVIIGVVGIYFKAKTYKKEKFIALIIGFSLLIIIPMLIAKSPISNPPGKNVYKIPQLKSINDAVIAQFPDIDVSSVRLQDYTSGESLTRAVLTLNSTQEITTENLKSVAVITCDVLDTYYKVPNKKVVLVYNNNELSDTCVNWRK